MKKFLVLFLMLVLCLGAMTSTASAREKIEFWFHAANETSNAEYEKLFGILNEIQDEYEFVYTGFASSNFADSLNMAIATQTMPDVISTGFSNITNWTAQDALVDMTRYFEQFRRRTTSTLPCSTASRASARARSTASPTTITRTSSGTTPSSSPRTALRLPRLPSASSWRCAKSTLIRTTASISTACAA